MHLEESIKAEAQSLGFSVTGITDLAPPTHLPVFLNWLGAGRHAGMNYLASERSILRRSNPAEILPGGRSILLVGARYTPPPPVDGANEPGTGRIAAYAWSRDYHDVIIPRLDELVEHIQRITGKPLASRTYSDTGAVLERDLAQKAGLGWVGKNTCLITPGQGSFQLLGELFLDAELEPDPPFISDHCGSCRRCIDACPTGCILPDRTIDAGRCISYLTIENKGAIPVELRPVVGDWVFGCDICQQVCPWNIRFAQSGAPVLPGLEPHPEWSTASLIEDIKLTPDTFKQKFKDNPVLRSKYRGYLRNIAVVIGNQRDERTLPDLKRLMQDEAEPLIRAHVAWALGQLGNTAARQVLQTHLYTDPADEVRREIRLALDQA